MHKHINLLKLICLLVIAHSSISLTAQRSTIENTGDIILYTLPISTLATSLLIKDKKGSWQFVKSFLLTQATTGGIKLAISKERPDMSDNDSFPSGHTSTTFHSASYIHRRYGFKYSIPAYALAGFTAASRIDSDKHDIVDVLAGATIGIGSNLLFTTEYQKEHFQISFSSYEKNYLAGFTYKF